MIRLKEKYNKEAVPAMIEKFGYKNRMVVPAIEKVVVNTGFGKRLQGKTSDEQKKIQESVLVSLAEICGQKAVLAKAKKAVAAFKIRKGMPIGAKVTLRGSKMNDFIDRLIHLTLPRTRDFKGIPQNAVDGKGNLTIAIKEHIAFPEVLPEKAKEIFGLEVTVVITSENREQGMELLKLLGFPIKKD